MLIIVVQTVSHENFHNGQSKQKLPSGVWNHTFGPLSCLENHPHVETASLPDQHLHERVEAIVLFF